ncbi:MAG: gamma-glutamyltransferase family protein [Conexivisphaerales archaeon]
MTSNAFTTRAPTVATKGVVATSHQLASFAGASILKQGGNAVDASIATSAVLCVTQNNLCGLGGDAFALVRMANRVIGINGSGRAGRNASTSYFSSRGYQKIPERGPLSAITVPGLVSAWGELYKRYASMELKELLEPAIRYASEGFPITPNYSESIRRSISVFSEFKEWCKVFLPEGRVPEAGFLFRQPDLASSLRLIVEEGCESMYKGRLSELMVRGIEKEGGLLVEEDFAEHSSIWCEPVSTSYRGINVYETPPNSQGAVVLLWLNLLEQYDLAKIPQSDALKIFAETYKVVNMERSTKVGDPEYLSLPSDFTSKEYAQRIYRTDSTSKTGNISTDEGDTTYFCVADSEGNCVSMIQSNYMGFGSGLVPEGTGIVMQNRGCYFTLDKDHHNCLEPGKRTFHTLCASMAEMDGEAKFCLGSMGGDIQPQIHVQLITNLIDKGLDIQSSIDRPRWSIPGTIYEEPSSLVIEPGLVEIPEGYEISGLKLKPAQRQSASMGHAQGIVFLKEGLMAGADPRGDGAAVGF